MVESSTCPFANLKANSSGCQRFGSFITVPACEVEWWVDGCVGRVGEAAEFVGAIGLAPGDECLGDAVAEGCGLSPIVVVIAGSCPRWCMVSSRWVCAAIALAGGVWKGVASPAEHAIGGVADGDFASGFDV